MTFVSTTYLRNFVFGVEDSLVSTVGLLSGVAIAGMGTREIFITGLILIFVEAISMAAGSFLSESTAEEMRTGSDRVSTKSYLASLTMLISYFISGFIPLVPYLFLSASAALWASIGVSLAALLVLGAASGALTRTSLTRNAFRMVLIGGLAIGIGTIVGTLVGG
ncbi:MAG: VIT1/CCC1 transporter family protein [Minisyncoccia bacterium]